MPFVAVSPDEWKVVLGVAIDRHVSAVKKGLKDSVNKKKNWLDDLQYHIMGALGEYAASVNLGLPFKAGVDTFRDSPDLDGIEVRFRSNPEWQLILRDRDKDDAKYVLTRGLPPGAVEVVGWVYGKDAKQVDYIKNYGGKAPAYFVPDSALSKMEDIK